MRRPRLALLDASHGTDHTRRNFRRELDADLVEFDVCRETPPAPDALDVDGAVVTGSRASVYDDESWIPPLVEWVREAAADGDGLPVLGVCYGHQVLAEALGGRVADMGEYEIGYREVTHSGADALFSGIPETFTVFTTHSDAVVELPPGATLVAENDYGVHGFRKGNAVGVQFHPEYDRGTAESIAREKELDPDRRRAVLDGITPENYDAACEAKRLFENFLDEVRATRDAPAV